MSNEDNMCVPTEDCQQLDFFSITHCLCVDFVNHVYCISFYVWKGLIQDVIYKMYINYIFKNNHKDGFVFYVCLIFEK